MANKGAQALRTQKAQALACAFASCIKQKCRKLRSGNLAGTQAAGAGMNTAGFAVDNRLYLHNVGLPSSVGTSVRMRYLDSESYVLTAEITFCHFLHLL